MASSGATGLSLLLGILFIGSVVVLIIGIFKRAVRFTTKEVVRSAKEIRNNTTNTAFIPDIKMESVDSKDVIPYVLANYDRATEYGIADAEYKLTIADPFSPDKGLLYALRVSLCVPNIRNLKTLASRYNTACYGAGGYGLLESRRSLNHQQVNDFLSKKYLNKFTELADIAIQKAQEAELSHKTKQAKINIWSRTKDTLKESVNAFEHKLSSLDVVIDALYLKIDCEIERLNS